MLLWHRKAKREGLVAADRTNEFARPGEAAGAPGGDAPAVALRRRLLGLLDRAAPKVPEDLDLAEAVCAELEPGWPRYAGLLRPRQVREALAGLPPLDPGDRDWLASPELARACLRGAMAARAGAGAVTSAAAGDRSPAAA